MARNNALNISRLIKYNFKFVTLEEVVLLEYFLAYYQKGLLHEVVPSRIEAETGIKRSRIERYIEMLQKKGFIHFKVEKFRTIFSVDMDEIIAQLHKLVLNQSKYAYQYFYAIQNPNAFKKRKSKRIVVKQAPAPVITETSVKTTPSKSEKPKQKPEPPKQMSLF